MKAGFSVKDITPNFCDVTDSRGILTTGYRNAWVKDVGTSLFVRTAAITDKNGQLLVIVTTDTLKYHYADSIMLEQWFCEKYQCQPSQLLLNASHTHSAPNWYYNSGCDYSRIYRNQLLGKVKESITEAIENMQSMRLKFIRVKAPDMALNRRLPLPGEGISFRPNVDASVDEDLDIFAFYKDNEKTPSALLWTFACHPTACAAKNINADYPGAASRALKKILGHDLITMFAQGAGGDIKPNFVQYNYWVNPDTDKVEVIPEFRYLMNNNRDANDLENYGRRFAEIIVDALENKKLQDVEPELKTAYSFAEIPCTQPLEHNRDHYQRMLDSANDEQQRYDALQNLVQFDSSGNTIYPVRVAKISLTGELQLIAMSNEVCHTVGRLVKNNYPDKTTVFFGYNSFGNPYLPDDKIFAEGGYEGSMMKVPAGYSFDKNIISAIDSI